MTRTLTVSLLLLALTPFAEAETFRERWERKVKQFDRENRSRSPEQDVVLFGSSSMEGWKHRMSFLPTVGPRTLNRGISGDNIGMNGVGLLNRLDASVIDAKPKFVFVFNGRNSIGRRDGVARTTALFEQVVRRIKAEVPGVHVVIVTVPSVRGRYRRLESKIAPYNANLKEIAARTDCPVIDLYADTVASDGRIAASMTSDGLHMSNKGYRIFARRIEATVARLEREDAEREAAERERRFAERLEAERQAVRDFIAEGERLLALGDLRQEEAAALRRQVQTRRANPNRCFEHRTVARFLSSLRSARGLTGGVR